MDENKEKTINEELKENTFKYFKEKNISIPIDVYRAIETVFDEVSFEKTFTNEDSISLYSIDDIDEFEGDTSVFTELNIQIGSEYSSGDLINKYSYYGKLNTKGAYTEYINLYDGEELINEVKKVEKSNNNQLENKNDWCIVLLEEQKFSEGTFESIPRLYIYAPYRWSD